MSTDLSFSAINLPSLRDPDAARVEAQAQARGYAAGYAAGLRAAQKELDERRATLDVELDRAREDARASVQRSIETLTSAIHSAENQAMSVVEEAQDVLAAAALDLAEAVIEHELSDGERSARSMLARVLGSLTPGQSAKIRMNPEDAARLLPELDAHADLTVVADPTIKSGDAIAVLPDGWLDARIGSALARARDALIGDES